MWPLWFLILGWLLTVFIIIGNGLVIYLIITRRKLRTKTNWFVLSLAVADFAFGLIYFPNLPVCGIKDETCFTNAIKILFSIGIFFMFASILNLCTLTLDRYLAIAKPMRYITFMTTKRVVRLISAAWGVALLGVHIPYLIMSLASPGKKYYIMHNNFWMFLDILNICVCVFLLFATTRMFLIARRHARQNAALVAQLKFNHRIQHGRVFKPQEAAATKMVGVVVAVFFICYLMDIYDTACYLSEGCTRDNTIWMLLTPLKLLNSAINPLAYALFKREIRKELRRLCCCKRQHYPLFSYQMETEKIAVTLL